MDDKKVENPKSESEPLPQTLGASGVFRASRLIAELIRRQRELSFDTPIEIIDDRNDNQG